MVIYLEYVILDNLVVDYFLIKTMSNIFKERYRRINIFISILLGVVSAVFLPYMLGNLFLGVIYRIMSAVLIVLVLKRYKTIKSYLKALLSFVGLTAVLSGLILGVLNAFNIRYTISGVLFYDMDLPMGLLLLIVAIVVWLINKITVAIRSAIKESNYLVDMVIEDNGVSLRVRGFLDSGNMVVVDGESVNIISLDSFEKLHRDISLIKLFENGVKNDSLKEIKYIDIGGIGKKKKYLSFIVDKIVLEGIHYPNQRVAVSYRNFDNFDCILSNYYLGGLK